MQKGEKSFLDTLYEMTELEIADKNKRAMNACVKVANFPFIKTMDDFNFSFQPSLRKEEIIGTPIFVLLKMSKIFYSLVPLE